MARLMEKLEGVTEFRSGMPLCCWWGRRFTWCVVSIRPNCLFWLPWEFSWPEYLATVLTFICFARGLKVCARRPAIRRLWRLICFAAGVASFYIVLQTHIDYYAQHMFFVHRWAHFVLHHAGAFLIAMGMCGPVLWAGMPDFLKPADRSRGRCRRR